MLLVLFGPPAAGKTFVGQLLRNHFDFFYYDADDDLTPEIKKSIHERAQITPQMREKYFSSVLNKIEALSKINKKIAVSQAWIIDANRLDVLERFPEAKMVLLEAENELANQRLVKRNDWVDVQYANQIREHFEMPTHSYYSLDNNHDQQHLTEQLEKLLNESFNNTGN